MARRLGGNAGGRWRAWHLLGVLLLVVLVPTACMLWFLAAAVQNANLAARQRLTDVYRDQVLEAKRTLRSYWQGQLSALDGAAALPAPQRFGKLVTTCEFDTVILRGATPGASYPARPAGRDDPLEQDPNWLAARSLEFGRADPAAAAEAYAALAEAAPQASVRARALRAQARSLAKAGQRAQAAAILTGPLAAGALAAAAGPDGRLVAPAAALRALELMKDANSAAFVAVARRLRGRLDDYGEPAIPSAQRLFLMEELHRLTGGGAFATLAAERCAAAYLETPQRPASPHRWTPAAGGGLWHAASADGRAVAVCRQERLIAVSERVCSAADGLTGITIAVSPPSAAGREAAAFLAVPAPGPLAGWQMEARLVGEDPFAAAASRQNTVYLWTAGLGVVAILAAALVVAGALGRQMRLARLKNDLIATVSHELKTPLSSMRVLIDTLVAGRCSDERAGEYHRMIAKENERLSRLIENFLTFSRMERHKAAFEFADLDIAEVVSEAVESARERFSRPGCELAVDVPGDLPPVRGDRDALVTVLLNLLDNAWKYTPDAKRISVRARPVGPEVHVSVSDNGIGLSRRAAKRVFDRFYQADQRLSRAAGGCGLGLSIVQFIVTAHGGSVDIASRPGEGSTFTVRLPAGSPIEP